MRAKTALSREDRVLITLKVDIGSCNRVIAGDRVRRGEVLGFSPHFDDQLVLSPFDGIIERIRYDSEERAVLINIRRQGIQSRVAHS